MTEINYEKDLAIDPGELDEEWLNQPVLMERYGRLSADAQRERDQLKEKMDVVRAETDNAIRENPTKYKCPTDKAGAPKPTEAWIAAAILTTEEYRKASDTLIEANYKLNLLNSAVRAMEHRKKALEKLVELFGLQYFAGPKEPRQLMPGKRMPSVAVQADATVRRRMR